jgi:hypothetical protein
MLPWSEDKELAVSFELQASIDKLQAEMQREPEQSVSCQLIENGIIIPASNRLAYTSYQI